MLLLLLLLACSAASLAQEDLRLGTLLSVPEHAQLLSPVATARQGAMDADAALYADSQWRRAERTLDRLLGDLERGRKGSVEERAATAVSEYRVAHAAALKSVLLAEARNALREAERSDLARRTPLLLGRVQRTLREAEVALDEAPDQPQRAQALADLAMTDLARAQVLATTLRSLSTAGESSAEAVLLAWAEALTPLREALGDGAQPLPPALAGDPAALTEQLIASVQRRGRRLAELDAELDTRNAVIRELQTRLAQTDSELDDIARDRNDMARALARQERARERLQSLRDLFTAQEAELLREGEVFVLRLTGFAFAVGGTEVGSDAAPLLDKVAQAIRLFPASTVVVEGHTDSSGDAATNLRVSQERAASVREALLARTGMAPSRMTSRGEGEARPVASNESASGRARNRRIEVRIDPREQSR
ncbi:MAG: OmpA family protein [Pseudomonadota bacterium]